MAVEAPVLYNNWWVYLRDSMGSTHLNPNDKQIHNAYRMRTELQNQGYCPEAIAGVIGCAQQESSLTTGAIQKYSVLPQGGETLAECTNAYMLQYYTPSAGGQGYGLGLLQWDRYSATYQSHDLLGWCNANNYLWYDGNGQMDRLLFEYNHDSQYHFWRLNYGASLTWDVYKHIDESQFHYDARECASVWDSCWELSSGEAREVKKDNAEFWYDYFNDHPTPPGPGTGLPPWMYFIFNRKKVIKNVKRLQC